MKRGDLYRVYKGNDTDTKDFRVFVIVSRQLLIDSKFSTVVCAPVYSSHDGLSTQVLIGTDFGLKKDSSIHCDELVSILKSKLTNYIGSLSKIKSKELNNALINSLEID
ncbi:MAG: type II toxin-antitoxin system PemK/MazF family toxin [Leptospiraceae bacterium]|nr:type II toxin-antitoxin system PemK/MazF family toxin [Leptospiraceae bacterium]